MINAGQRLVIFQNRTDAGAFHMPNGAPPVHTMNNYNYTVENHYNTLGGSIFTHDHACYSVWDTRPLNASVPNKPWTPLFVMNHFHVQGELTHARFDNRFDQLKKRTESCKAASGGRKPNYIALDFIQQGDAVAFAAVQTQGGIILYEGNNASQDIVCGVPGQRLAAYNLKNNNIGCENDEARSAEIVDPKLGMKFVVYDSPDGRTDDDYAIITVRRTVPGGVFTINSFESTQANNDFSIWYSRKNGLDGKVSRLEVKHCTNASQSCSTTP